MRLPLQRYYPALAGRKVLSILLAVTMLGILGACSEPVRPGVGDHWHVAYGFYVCDRYVGNLMGDLTGFKADGKPESKNYRIVGVHSHNDGLIHFHPYSGLAAGPKANLGLFLSMYGVGISDTQVDLPEYLGGTLMEYLTVCQTAQGQTDGELRVQYWPDATDAQKYTVYTDNLKDIPLIEDGAAVTLVFAPAGAIAPLPPSVGTPITDVPGGVLQGPPTTQP